MTTNYLHTLSVKQLIGILRHVQLGHEYLSKKLPRQEYQDLLSIGSLSNNQLSRMKSDRQEKVGNVSIVVNTILTSCFGAWLGFSAFSQISFISPFGFIIILCALGFGFLTAYLSYSLTHSQARLAFKKQQLCNVEQVVIDIIINKRKTKITALQEKINHILMSLDKTININNDTCNENKLFDCLKKMSQPFANAQYKTLIAKSYRTIQYSVKKLTFDKDQKIERKEGFDSADFLINTSMTNASYIKILTKTDIDARHQIPKVDNWLRRNSMGILVGLLPTFLGSFASMFVFLNGLPALLAGIGVHFGFTATEVFALKQSALLLALSISLYFAYSHIHSNYKAFKRAKQIEISENIIEEKTHQMLQLMSQLTQWSKIYYQLQLIKDLRDYASATDVAPVNVAQV